MWSKMRIPKGLATNLLVLLNAESRSKAMTACQWLQTFWL